MRLDESVKRRLADDLDAFFTEERGGHLDWACYLIPQRWADIVRAAERGENDYYLATREAPIHRKTAEKLAEFIQEGHRITSLYVKGPGTGNKLVPYAERLNGGVKAIILEDLELDFLDQASSLMRENCPESVMVKIPIDFERAKGQTQISDNVLSIEPGGTFFNREGLPWKSFPRAGFVRRLKNFTKHFEGQGYLIITQHINRDTERLKQMYSGEDHSAFIRTPFELAVEHLDTEGLDLDMFVHQPRFIEESSVNAHLFRLRDDIERAEFKIEGKKYTLTQEFLNSVINSYVPTEQTFLDMAKDAGFHRLETFYDDFDRDEGSNDQNTIAVHVFSYDKNAKKLDKDQLLEKIREENDQEKREAGNDNQLDVSNLDVRPANSRFSSFT